MSLVIDKLGPRGRRLRMALLVSLLMATLTPVTAEAAGPADVTAAVRVNRDVRLSGDAIITLPSGKTTYTGVFSGTGTLTVAGTGTLVLTRNSDFTLPVARRREKLVTTGGNHPVTRVVDADPPAVIVRRGATLQYGSGTGTAGAIGHYTQVPGLAWNTLNHRVDGTLEIAVSNTLVHLGVMSGSGLITGRRFIWPGMAVTAGNPFTGVFFNGTGVAYGDASYPAALDHVRAVINQGSFITYAPTNTRIFLRADIYSQSWGNDVNFHSMPGGQVVMSGVYSWSDNGSMTAPALSKPALNYQSVAHRDNTRGINIEGANVQWGDGTSHRFFLPGNVNTTYINMHSRNRRSRLTFDYDGPVTLSTPISGGIYHDTLSAPGAGDVVIKGTPGNAVTFAAKQNYNGSTTIERGASLRLGTGRAGHDGSLRSGGLYRIIDDGGLILNNAKTSLLLAKLSGSGSLTQAGPASTTLTGATTYRGATAVTGGTLAVRGGSLTDSSGVDLKTSGATLDLTHAGSQAIRQLTGATGSRLKLGRTSITVGDEHSTTFAGIISGTGGTVHKTGSGTLTLTAQSPMPGGTWQIERGTLNLGPGGGIVTAKYTQSQRATLAITLAEATGRPLTVSGDVSLSGGLKIQGRAPAHGKSFTIVDNTGSQATSGTFTGLPEGAKVIVSDGDYRISYHGGDGNDVVLTGTRAPGSQSAGKSGADLNAGLTGSGSGGHYRLIGGLLAVALALALALGLGTRVGRRRARNGRVPRVTPPTATGRRRAP